ncbi:MAG TPA: translocation/assembly module TamB domain-containing protein, partial [Thermodesulfobacteriota bacterium]|nr:translocation/assembly module TamB domain-containing protein [Thermodesulfobacteriota bacterium]
TLNKVNVGLILNEEKYTSNLNANLQLDGSVPLNGDLLDNLTASVDGEISPSTFSGIDINDGKINASYSEETLNVESFLLDSNKFNLKAQGTREKEKGVDVTFYADVKNLDFISEFLSELDLSGSVNAEGRIQGNIKTPQVTLTATVSDFKYEDIVQLESAKLDGSGVVDLENPQLQIDGEIKEVTIQDRNIESVELQARNLRKGITTNISIVEAPQRSYQFELQLADFTSQEKHLEIEQAILNLEEITLQNRKPINVTIHPNRAVVDSFNLYHNSSSILADADVNFDGRINADLDINSLNLISISRILEFEPPIQGTISGDASVQGTMENPRIKANIGAQNLEFKGFQSNQTSLNLSYLNRELDIDLGVSQNAVQILRVDGGADVDLNLKKIGENLKYATFDLTVSSNGFELSPIAEITEKDISGVITGNVVFQGTMENPRIKANLNTQNLGFRELTTDKTALNLSYLNRKLDINLNMTESGREILLVNGAVNVDLNLLQVGENLENATFDLVIKSSGFELSPFAKLSEEITKLDGKVLIDLRASGSFDAPQLNGQIRPQDVLIKTKSPENEIKVATGLIEMEGEKIFLRNLEIRTDDDGIGRFQGEADLGIPSYSLKGKMEDFQLKLKPISAQLDGNLDASGSDGKVKVTGRIEAERARIIIPEKTTKEVKDIKFVDERDQQEEEKEFVIEDTEEESDYFTENVALDLRVSIPHNAWVRGRGANIELEGDMNVLKQYGEPLVLTGSINTVRGNYEILGKLFRIEQGTVSFQGIPEINPLLDVTALYEVSDVDIFVNIGGTVKKPEIKLTSEPVMEETDIFSYLVFGTSSNKIGAGERVSLESRAAQILGNLAAGQLKGFVGEELSLDVIQIRAGEGGPEVEAGKYLTDDLYIAYERGPSELITTSTPTLTDKVRVEYRLFDFLTLQSDVGGEQAGGDVFFHFDY